MSISNSNHSNSETRQSRFVKEPQKRLPAMAGFLNINQETISSLFLMAQQGSVQARRYIEATKKAFEADNTYSSLLQNKSEKSDIPRLLSIASIVNEAKWMAEMLPRPQQWYADVGERLLLLSPNSYEGHLLYINYPSRQLSVNDRLAFSERAARQFPHQPIFLALAGSFAGFQQNWEKCLTYFLEYVEVQGRMEKSLQFYRNHYPFKG